MVLNKEKPVLKTLANRKPPPRRSKSIMNQDLQEIKIIRLGANLEREILRGNKRKAFSYCRRFKNAILTRSPDVIVAMEQAKGLWK